MQSLGTVWFLPFTVPYAELRHCLGLSFYSALCKALRIMQSLGTVWFLPFTVPYAKLRHCLVFAFYSALCRAQRLMQHSVL